MRVVISISLSRVQGFDKGFHLERTDAVERFTDRCGLVRELTSELLTLDARLLVNHVLETSHGEHEDAA